MSQKISLIKALTLEIGNLEKEPVVTDYRLGIFLYNIYSSGHYGKLRVPWRSDVPSRTLSNKINMLTSRGILVSNKSFPIGTVFNILGKKNPSHEDIICTIDPFSYISHFSAMDYYGLTDRIPKTIFLSSPIPNEWTNLARERMNKDLGENCLDYMDCHLPKLRRVRFKKIGTQHVYICLTKHFGSPKPVKGRMLRISTIGRTFLDMLQRPDLCGGMHHVVDVFRDNAGQYLPLILDEINTNGTPIDKVRAGYILEKVCDIRKDIIDSWKKFAQRGGSRKIDPSREYSPVFDEEWCLSLNIKVQGLGAN
jgi:predicted transcriptional regulator of viral defense system